MITGFISILYNQLLISISKMDTRKLLIKKLMFLVFLCMSCYAMAQTDNKGLNNRLFIAVKNMNYETVRSCLNTGADVNHIHQSNIFGWSNPLNEAIRNRDVKMLNLLMEYNVQINFSPKNGLQAPLYEAVNAKNAEIVKLLIEKGADVNQTNELGITIFDLAIQFGEVKIVQELLDNQVVFDQQQAFFTAIRVNHIKLVEYFFDLFSIDINAPNKEGITPLEYATTYSGIDMVKCLLDKNALITKKAVKLSRKADQNEIYKLLKIEKQQ